MTDTPAIVIDRAAVAGCFLPAPTLDIIEEMAVRGYLAAIESATELHTHDEHGEILHLHRWEKQSELCKETWRSAAKAMYATLVSHAGGLKPREAKAP